jgi:DNA-binding FrmR family transcriptional regulator
MPKIYSFINGVQHKFDDRTLDEAKSDCINIINQISSGFISEAGLDQITQQNAALGIYPPERCEAIKSYISACRNEYLRCKAIILSAQTNDEADAVQFVAPQVPEGI